MVELTADVLDRCSDDAALATDKGDASAWLRTKPVGVVVGGALRAPGSAK